MAAAVDLQPTYKLTRLSSVNAVQSSKEDGMPSALRSLTAYGARLFGATQLD